MSTGGRVLPSITGGGLSRGTRAILEATLADRVAQRQDRQLDITERAQAINQITTLAGFLPPGTTLGELGAGGMDLFSRAFQMDTSGLESLELRPETLETALDARARDLLDSEDGSSLLLPSVRNLLGLEPSEEVANVRDLEASLRFDALSSILRDPTLVTEFTHRVLGRQPIELQIPGVDGTFEFDSETAANIFGQIYIARLNNSNRLDLANADQIKPLQTQIQEAVAEAGFSVSPTALTRVFEVYNSAAEEGQLQPVVDFLTNPRVTEGEKLALQYLLGSIGVGEQAFLGNLPPQLSNFLRIGNVLRDVLPAEQIPQVMESITQALDPSFTAQLVDPLFGGLQLMLGGEEIGARNPMAGGEAGVDLGDLGFNIRNVPESILFEEMRNSIADGTETRESLTRQLGADLVTRALPPVPTEEALGAEVAEAVTVPEGGLNPTSVPQAFRADVQRLNTLIRRRDQTQGDIARQSLTNVIDRLRARIDAGIRAAGGSGG